MTTPNDAPAQASVEALRTALKDIAQHTDPDDGDNYRADDREGCFDTVYAIATRALALPPPPTVGAEDEASLFHVTGERITRKDLNNAYRSGQENGRLAAHPLDGAPAPAADGQRVKDGRPEGWTEALAISFMAANGHNPEMGMFAKSFNEGAWRKIKDEWPEFVEFVSVHIRACLATDKEGA